MPSPGMDTTVCFAMITNSLVNLYLTVWDFLSRGRYLIEPQLGTHQVLHATRNHQRLRHRAQRRKGELLSGKANRTGSEVNLDFVSRNNSLLLARDRLSIFIAQALHQLRRFDAQEAVVERVAQVGLRETARDDQRNTSK